MAATAMATWPQRLMRDIGLTARPDPRKNALAFYDLGTECAIALYKDRLDVLEWDREGRVWVRTGGDAFDADTTPGERSRAYQQAVMDESIYLTNAEVNGEEGELKYLTDREGRIRDANGKALRELMGPVVDELEGLEF